MQRLRVRTPTIEAFDSAADAIRESERINSQYRTLDDRDINGRQIVDALWDEEALSLQLDDGRYLNVLAEPKEVCCSLDSVPKTSNRGAMDATIELELDGNPVVWNRQAAIEAFIGKKCDKLHYGSSCVYLYVEDGILACYLVEQWEVGRALLFWTESE
jgi:hypothetical protein